FDQCNLLEYVEKGMLEVEATDFDNKTPGTYTIYVSYGLDTTSFDVTVKGKRVIPSGDSNGDGKFTVADVVTMQSYIMGKKTAKLADWKNVDFCEDGKIDVYDFIVMRENIVENEK
ncbi:MAG: dockerin type I repeat-containing protein, partial [Ruminococcus sp.]|nr:dockerin type I repeat-containing protein [Ruminococcus sp.]